MRIIRKLWIGLGVLVILSPLGLILPYRLKAGAAWGEWGADEMQKLVGYIPQGLEKLSSLWNAPMPDYAFKGWQGKGLPQLSVTYIISAIVGVVSVVAITYFLGKKLASKNE